MTVRMFFALAAVALFITAGPVVSGWPALLCTALGVIAGCAAIIPRFIHRPTP